MKTKKKAKKRAKQKPEKNEKRKHFVKGWTQRLSRFLTKKILPEWVEIIFAKPEGLDLENRKWKALNCCTFFIYDLKQNIMENPFEIIIEKLDNIETLLKQIYNTRNGTEIPLSNTNEIMNLEQLAKYVNQSKSAMYKQTANRTIPFYKNGKRVYFKKSEIDAWLTKTKISTVDEIEEKALNYIIKRGKVCK